MNISGRLTQDATVSKTTTGKEVVNFSVAVNDGYKNRQGEWVDNTAFIECAYWRSAKPVSWLKQGLYVELTGQISARAWTGKDGTLKAGLNFTTSNIKPAWGTASEKDSVQASNKQQNGSLAKEDEKDDLPF
ncbi:single-stranded DNA-binding protein [Sphingobacterium sp. UGAL515B_05]|uniref:single-stranded DNA-binding protein n=1 Tax=Sphingobacterium sp. UGAL515B_05 TaxID=2986767 RepID=UPI00295326AC|nr:single-stranded DNA-binding protein [Sphingobacterium sp. UGAL515B_05]WON94320.1 single-stranded DNA-binding protein [Sphingobacterium sp. UGAL515B_05]